jgi:hypothetical protein
MNPAPPVMKTRLLFPDAANGEDNFRTPWLANQAPGSVPLMVPPIVGRFWQNNRWVDAESDGDCC